MSLAAASSERFHNTALVNPALTDLPQWSKPIDDGVERVTAD